MPDEYKSFDVQQHVDVTLLNLKEHKVLHDFVVAGIREELLDFVHETKPLKLLVNFSAVNRCTSSIIGVMVDLKTMVKSLGGDMRLCGMTDEMREVYRICNLDGPFFQIYDSATQGLQAF